MGDAEAVACAQSVPRQPWRLLVHGAEPPAWNMAVDEAILDAVVAGLAGPTLRVYRWDRLSISVGRFQDASRDLDLARCAALGVPVVGRPTGGRAVLHGYDQTFSVVVPFALLGATGASVTGSYRLLARAITRALAGWGVVARIAVGRAARARSGDCFGASTRADVVSADGDKLVGSAQCRRRGVLLQQSSLRHLPPPAPSRGLFRGEAAPGDWPLAGIAPNALEEGLISAFREELGLCLSEDTLGAWEVERAAALLAARTDGLAPAN